MSITKTTLTVLLASHGCTEPEFQYQEFCTTNGAIAAHCVYSSRNGKRFTLGLWKALSQHTTEEVEEKIVKKLAALVAAGAHHHG